MDPKNAVVAGIDLGGYVIPAQLFIWLGATVGMDPATAAGLGAVVSWLGAKVMARRRATAA